MYIPRSQRAAIVSRAAPGAPPCLSRLWSLTALTFRPRCVLRARRRRQRAADSLADGRVHSRRRSSRRARSSSCLGRTALALAPAPAAAASAFAAPAPRRSSPATTATTAAATTPALTRWRWYVSSSCSHCLLICAMQFIPSLLHADLVPLIPPLCCHGLGLVPAITDIDLSIAGMYIQSRQHLYTYGMTPFSSS